VQVFTAKILAFRRKGDSATTNWKWAKRGWASHFRGACF